VFDEISKEARFLSNRKLHEQCKVARGRCNDTRQLLLARQAMVDRARREIEMCRANGISLVQLGSDTPSQSAETQNGEEWFPHCSQSAPGTPALMLRSTKCDYEIRRRSQSFDDTPSFDQMEAENASQSMDAQTDDSKPDMDDSAVEIVPPEISEMPVEPPVPAPRFICGATPTGESDESTTDELLTADCENCSISSDTTSDLMCDTSNDNALLADSTEEFSYGTVDRADKFLHTDQEITIPLDHMTHTVQSPRVEDGHVIQYVPTPTLRKTLYKPTPDSESSTDNAHSQSVEHLTESAMKEEMATAEFGDYKLAVNGIVKQLPEGKLNSETASSQEELGEDSKEVFRRRHVSPVLKTKQSKQALMSKRRSFHGFASAIAMPLLTFARNKKTAEDNIKRLSTGSISVSEVGEDHSLQKQLDHLNVIENSLRNDSESIKSRRANKTISLVTGSSESLAR